MSDSVPRGGAAARGPVRQETHTCSPAVSYRRGPRKVNPRRTRYPNLSPTRPPVEPAPALYWPAWTDRDRWVTGEVGLPLFREGGC